MHFNGLHFNVKGFFYFEEYDFLSIHKGVFLCYIRFHWLSHFDYIKTLMYYYVSNDIHVDLILYSLFVQVIDQDCSRYGKITGKFEYTITKASTILVLPYDLTKLNIWIDASISMIYIIFCD